MTRPPLPVLPFFMSPDIRAEIETAMHAYADACVAAETAALREQLRVMTASADVLHADNIVLKNNVITPLQEHIKVLCAAVDDLRYDDTYPGVKDKYRAPIAVALGAARAELDKP